MSTLAKHPLDEFELSYDEVSREIELCGAPLATATAATDFPCRAEPEAEIDAETDAVLSEIVRRANCYAELLAALRFFAVEIGIGSNPDYQPQIRLPREAIVAARAAYAKATGK